MAISIRCWRGPARSSSRNGARSSIEFAEQARISRQLVSLKDDVPLEIGVDALGVRDPDADALLGFLRTMEFNTLTKRIAEGLGTEAPPPLAVSVGASVKSKTEETDENIAALEEEAASEDADPRGGRRRRRCSGARQAS